MHIHYDAYNGRARGTAWKSRLGSKSGIGIEIGQLYRDYDRMMDRANHHAVMAHTSRFHSAENSGSAAVTDHRLARFAGKCS
jgi:hypothetical protein